ncbi:MAG: hypothetical protein RL660_2771 [Bacteroidota bacterium]|jgi:hypothetical protein
MVQYNRKSRVIFTAYMRAIVKLIAVLAIFVAIHTLSACRKQSFITSNALLEFSTDTVSFDTVFTTVGSVTQEFLIYNRNNKWLKLDDIRLRKGSASNYRLNIDGAPQSSATNLEIAPFDSMYVFVAITVDPSAADLPFIVEDDIDIQYAGTSKSVHLMSYGQNAIFINDSVLQGNITWTKQKPYVVVNSMLVDSTAKLTIEAGTRVYMHANSKLFVKGTLVANGTAADSIIFQGDRLDREYFGGDAAGEWCGLHFLQQSHDNVMQHCVIKNGGSPWRFYDATSQSYVQTIGALVYVEPQQTITAAPMLVLNSCYVGMSIAYGVLAFNSSVRATNTLFYTCGASNLAAIQGGTYNFSHCTFANYGYYLGNLPIVKHDNETILALTNNLRDGDGIVIATSDLNANFYNCIVNGTQKDGHEILINKVSGANHNVLFNSCVLTTTDTLDTLGQCVFDNYSLALLNGDVKFTEPQKLNFRPKAGSVVKQAGSPIGILFDIEETPRSAVTPSIGCYE